MSSIDKSLHSKSERLLELYYPSTGANEHVHEIEIDSLFRASPIVNFGLDFPSKGYTFVSENAYTVFGVTPTHLIKNGLSGSISMFAKEHRTLFTDELLPFMFNTFSHMAQNGKDARRVKMTYYIDMLDRNGKNISTKHIMKPISIDPSGLPIAAIKCIIDISEHKQRVQPEIKLEYLNANEEYETIESKIFYTAQENTKSLSAREQEILNLVAKGHSSKDIADKLSLSLHTVNNHRKNIVQKYKVKSLHQLTSSLQV